MCLCSVHSDNETRKLKGMILLNFVLNNVIAQVERLFSLLSDARCHGFSSLGPRPLAPATVLYVTRGIEDCIGSCILIQ